MALHVGDSRVPLLAPPSRPALASPHTRAPTSRLPQARFTTLQELAAFFAANVSAVVGPHGAASFTVCRLPLPAN